MAVFSSKINTSSETFLRQRKEMLELVDRLNELNGRGRAASEKRKPRFDARGQLTPRERLARLLDPGMPFLEIGNIAGYMVDTKKEEKSSQDQRLSLVLALFPVCDAWSLSMIVVF